MNIETAGLICGFGRHKGTLYTRLPISYLKWMVQVNHDRKDIAEAELDRRGTTTPTLEISFHAIDRASTRKLKIWEKTRKNGEGIASWLIRVAEEAYEKKSLNKRRQYKYMGMRFVFSEGGEWPTLVTIM